MTSADSWIAELWREVRHDTIARAQSLEKDIEALASDPQPITAGQAREEAHRLGGSLGSYGLTAGSSMARQLEGLLIDSQYTEAQAVAARLRDFVESSPGGG